MGLSQKQKRNNTRHDFLLTFFGAVGKHSIVEVNGFILVQQWSGVSNRWEVAIFRKESYRKVSAWSKANPEV